MTGATTWAHTTRQQVHEHAAPNCAVAIKTFSSSSPSGLGGCQVRFLRGGRGKGGGKEEEEEEEEEEEGLFKADAVGESNT